MDTFSIVGAILLSVILLIFMTVVMYVLLKEDKTVKHKN